MFSTEVRGMCLSRSCFTSDRYSFASASMRAETLIMAAANGFPSSRITCAEGESRLTGVERNACHIVSDLRISIGLRPAI